MSLRRPHFVLVCALFACAVPAIAQELPEFSFNVDSPIVPFPFKIKDAEFSSSLNAIIAVSETPNQLHIYRTETDDLVSVNLQLPPLSVSVSPDGHTAAVGHNAWISHVNLDDATLLQTVAVSAVVNDVVLGPNGWAYALPPGQWVSIHSVDLTTGVQSQSQSSIYGNTIARLHPRGESLHRAHNALSPADIVQYPIPHNIAQYRYHPPYHGD